MWRHETQVKGAKESGNARQEGLRKVESFIPMVEMGA